MSKQYRFSPSVLDKMQKVLDAEEYFESDFNLSDDGYKKSLDEIIAEREQEILDAINKVPQEPSEAAAQGTAFNECVDEYVNWKFTGMDYSDLMDKTGRVVVKDIKQDENGEHISWEAECDGFKFVFDGQLIKRVAEMVSDGTMQMHVQSELDTPSGNTVLLHGYPDYIQPYRITDLKTTSSYAHGKYERYWQRFVYPYIIIQNNLMESLDEFRFLVVEMKKDRKTGIISGDVFEESYTDVSSNDMEHIKTELEYICTALIRFCESHEEQITNQYYKGV